MLPPSLKRIIAHAELSGLALVACAVVFNAYYAAPELRINRVPLNDVVFHLAASERMETSFARGEPFLDPWVSEWSLGYPVWLSYQPLPHVVGAIALRVFHGFGDPAAIFAALFYLLIVTFPISVYIGARLLGLSPPAAGLAALLAFASSAIGMPGSYGLGYGSVVWRGSGLYTQLFALHLMVIAIGVSARALDTGKRNARVLAGVLLALTVMSHIIFGYAAFVSVALVAVVGPGGRRSERLVRLVTIVLPALLLLVWFVAPLVINKEVVNHSRWEDASKWDSYGAPFILRELLSGRLLDSGRLPWLSVLLGLGALGAVLSRSDARARRMLALCGLWLILFFGRATWGHLMILAGVPADLHLHRLQAVFELSAILLGAYGIAQLINEAWKRKLWLLAPAGVIAVGVVLIMIGADRAEYLNQNQEWGEENLAAYQREGPDLEAALADVRAILAERPGRVSAGKAASWGGQFKVGSVPVYAFTSLEHMDEVSFLYHSMSKTSDIMVLRDENNRGQDVTFGIRAIIAPASQAMPNYLRRRSVHGRFAVYESSPEGYFGIVDLAGHYAGPPSTFYEPNSAWLTSSLQPRGLVISLDPRAQVAPAIQRWEPMPGPTQEQTTLRGSVVNETKTGENYEARIVVNRPGYALVKITWNPDLAATVDGQPAPLIQVTPGFGAVAIPAGQHEVTVTYRPGHLRAILLVLGIGAFAAWWYLPWRSRAAELEAPIAARLSIFGERLAKPGVAVAAVLILAGVVALHPLVRGELISGHDATEYPPRVSEMARVIGDGQIPPVWAPDLSAGHGQPLFEFSPPLAYWIALPFRVVGFGLTDSVQLGLALLFMLGAWAVYGIGRHFQASRYASLGGAIAWLFGPYLCLDLFVRAAFAEAAGIAVAPIALLALLKAMERPSALRIALGAVAVGLIVLSHNVVALLLIPFFSLVVLVYGLVIFRSEGKTPAVPLLRRLTSLAAGGAAIAGAIGLTAYFWIPSLVEVSNLHQTRLLEGALDWSGHMISPMQILWPWWVYRHAVPVLDDNMNFALGLVHLGLATGGLLVLLKSRGRAQRALGITFCIAAVAGAILSTYWTTGLYAHVHVLQFVNRPWRALVIPGLLLPLLAIFAFERVGPRWASALLAVLVVVNLPHTEPQGYLTYDDEYYGSESLAKLGINTATQEEFEPRWTDVRPSYTPNALAGLSGPIEVTQISRRTAREEFSVRAPIITTVESSTFYYPGWTVMIDSTPAGVSPVPVRGTMQFAVPAGQHTVVLELRRTPVRSRALMVTIFTLLLLGVLAGIEYFRKRRLLSPLDAGNPMAVNAEPQEEPAESTAHR